MQKEHLQVLHWSCSTVVRHAGRACCPFSPNYPSTGISMPQTCEGMENPGLFLVDTVCWIILLILKRSSSKLSRSLRSSSDILWEVILRFWQELAGPRRSVEEIALALKETPISVEGQPDLVPVRSLFGEEHPWYQEMAENLRHNDPEILAAVIEFDQMHEQYEYERLFPLICCPVLIIQGSKAHGGLLTDEEIEHAVALLPNVAVARMQTVGHPLHTQEKEPVLLAMNAFLNTL